MLIDDDGMWSDDDEEETESFEENSEADFDNEDIGFDDGDGAAASDVDKDHDDEDHRFEVLTTEQVVEYLFKELEEVKNVVQIPTTTLRILLNHFKWDKERLYDAYYAAVDPEKLFEEARIPSPFKLREQESVSPSPDCEICYLPLNEDTAGLKCGHVFCTACWAEYLSTKIVQDGVSLSIQCPHSDCRVLADDDTVLRLLGDSSGGQAEKYQLLITNSLVTCNRRMRWCPAPDCGNAVRVFGNAASMQQPVLCRCGHAFCFACGEPWHYPVGCNGLRMWLKKCEDDSETANWINANTKDCPR